MSNKLGAYLAFCRGCGVALAGTLDEGSRASLARAVCRWILQGNVVRYFDDSRTAPWLLGACTCQPERDVTVEDIMKSIQ